MGTQVSITKNGTTTISIIRESNTSSMLTKRSNTESSISIISQSNKNKEIEFLISLKKVLQSLAQDDGCHNNIICDYCKEEDFRDHRYKCLICNDYDLCGDCFEQRNYNKNHQINHPVILFKQPVASQQCQVMLDLFQKQTKINRDDLEFIIHDTVTCDGCGLKPLVGVRFKCDQCIDYDLCYNCYKTTKTTKQHKANHSLVAIMTPHQNKFKIQDVNLAGSQKLGNGFFAQVYKAQWQNKTIALKKMIMTNDGGSNKELVTFKNEVLAYSEINSYKILQYYGCDMRKGNNGEIEFYIATEFMPNGTIESALKNNDQYTHRRKFQWLLTIVKGLRRLHDKQFVHKDIKPDNLLIDDCWNCKIGDMGVALHKNDQYTFDQGFAPRKYSAPEVLNGQPYSYKADVFSFGLLMNYIFTETEHIGEGQNITFKKDSPFFVSIINMCLKYDPDQRPTAKQLERVFIKFDEAFWENLPINKQDYIKSSKDEKDSIFQSLWEDLEYIAEIDDIEDN